MNKSKLIKIIKEEIAKIISEDRSKLSANADAAFADFDSMDSFGSDDPSTEQPSQAPPPAQEAKPQTKCQGTKYTKDCAIAFLKEFLPLLKARGRNAMRARSDCHHRHRVKQFKKVTSNSTGEKGYKVNGIIVMNTDI